MNIAAFSKILRPSLEIKNKITVSLNGKDGFIVLLITYDVDMIIKIIILLIIPQKPILLLRFFKKNRGFEIFSVNSNLL